MDGEFDSGEGMYRQGFTGMLEHSYFAAPLGHIHLDSALEKRDQTHVFIVS